jgi:hypothetical protein
LAPQSVQEQAPQLVNQQDKQPRQVHRQLLQPL